MGLLVVGSAFAIWGGDGSDAADVAVGYFAGITAWVVGDSMRTQRERAAWMATRRVEETQRAATQERLAIARDLHDIVAHNVSVIAVQAEAAQAVLASQPDAGGAGDGGRRRHRASVRSWSCAGCSACCARNTTSHRSPGWKRSTTSSRRCGARGWTSACRVRSCARSTRSPGLTAYRVVQEALTNVLKHAGPCATDVALLVSRRRVGRVASSTTARVRVPANGGHGLVGMRERVAVLGGTLDAGAGPAGGFAVRARLPLSA